MQHLQHFSIALHSRSAAMLVRIELNMHSDHYSFGVCVSKTTIIMFPFMLMSFVKRFCRRSILKLHESLRYKQKRHAILHKCSTYKINKRISWSDALNSLQIYLKQTTRNRWKQTKQNENVIKAKEISWSKQKSQCSEFPSANCHHKSPKKRWIFSGKFNFIDRFVSNILNGPKNILAPLTLIKIT